MINEILKHRPGLKNLLEANSMANYLQPVFIWNPSVFPKRKLLQSILLRHITSLYSLESEDVSLLEKQLENSWCVQTGEHIWIPRARGGMKPKISDNGLLLPSHNPMIFQGSVLWAAMNYLQNHPFSILAGTGRIPINNPMSGSHIEISRNMELIRTVPEKWHSSPQILVPAIREDTLDLIRDVATKNQHFLASNSRGLFCSITEQPVRGNLFFVEQVALIHSLIMNKAMSIRQLTIESEKLAVEFIHSLLCDEKSLLCSIFSSSNLLHEFLKEFSNIPTGWDNAGSPLWIVDDSGKIPVLTEYHGSLDVSNIKQLLSDGLIYPKGVLKFFAFMVEGGLLPIGGMCQQKYCTEIRDRAVKFLRGIGEYKVANSLASMPTQVVTITPCWGIEDDGRLTDVLDCIDYPVSTEQLRGILLLDGERVLENASSVLYPFFTGKPKPT